MRLWIEQSRFKLRPGELCCVNFLGNALYSLSASGVYKGISKFNAGGNPAMDWHPIQKGVEILPVASCYENQDKLWPDCPLGSFAYVTFTNTYKKNKNILNIDSSSAQYWYRTFQFN